MGFSDKSLSSSVFWGWATLVSAAVTIGFLLIFRANPAWDTGVSGMFFMPQACAADVPEWRSCGLFPLASDPFWDGLRDLGMNIPRLVMLFTFLALVAAFVFSPRPNRHQVQAANTGLLALFLGPLLITNWILKEFWGRARPFQTSEFGGLAEFSLPGTMVEECARNCSFVSGEAAAAFWLLWLIPLLPAVWRIPVGVVILAFAIFVAGLRVAFGRHFFSDVTVGGALSITCICFAYWFSTTSFAQTRLDTFIAWGTRQAAPLHR